MGLGTPERLPREPSAHSHCPATVILLFEYLRWFVVTHLVCKHRLDFLFRKVLHQCVAKNDSFGPPNARESRVSLLGVFAEIE